MSTTIDYDVYGHCVICHKNMIITQAVDGEIITRFTGEYREHEYVLDDGSIMRVAMCKQCQKELTKDDDEKIMETVYKGWEMETKLLLDKGRWEEKQRNEYLGRMKKRKIVLWREDLSKEDIKKRVRQQRKQKEKRNGPDN